MNIIPKLLVACEESQRVCIEFRKQGWDAFSCDIVQCSGGHPEWHICGDVLPLLNGDCNFTTSDGVDHYINSQWDMIIAFPPCTHLATSGAMHFETKRNDGRQIAAIKFFCKFLSANCDRIVIENPVGIISGDYICKWFPSLAIACDLPKAPSQIIHPWQFGDEYEKTTCLWIKGVPPLTPEIVDPPPSLEYIEWVSKKSGKRKREPKWYADAFKLPPEQRAAVRSKTFPGVARAMGEQWGHLLPVYMPNYWQTRFDQLPVTISRKLF